MKLKKLLLVLVAVTLVSCSNSGETSSDDNSSSSSSEDSYVVTSSGVKGALETLAHYYQSNHTTITVVSSDGGRGARTQLYFASDYYYHYSVSNEYGYAIQNNGSKNVFSLSCPYEAIVAGERVSDDEGNYYTSLYESNVFTSWKDVYETDGVSWSEEASQDLSKNKSIKLSMLGLLGLTPTDYYTQVQSLTFSVSDVNDMSTFTAMLQIGDYRYYEFKVSDLGNTHYDEVEILLADGTDYLVPNTDLTRIKEGFKSNNFTRDVLDYESETSIGYEYYLPDYWYGDYEPSLASQIPYGVMGINNKSYKETTLNGTYMFYLLAANGTDAASSPTEASSVSLATAGIYNSSPDVPGKVLNYPGNMLLWDKLEYCEPIENEENSYTVSDSAILEDFADNNQVTDIVESNGATLVRLDIAIGGAETVGYLNVTFDLYYNYNGATNYFRYYFFNFGYSNIEILDNWMAENLSTPTAE